LLGVVGEACEIEFDLLGACTIETQGNDSLIYLFNC